MQRSPNNKFDQQVKNTLENASVEPPAFLWNTIENQLPSNNTWYSKYKYLLLLLLLSVTSATSIFVYKNIVQESDVSTIALNKRLLKDETVSHDEKVKDENKNSSSTVTDENNTQEKNATVKTLTNTTSKKSSVASFYTKDKNDKETTESLVAKKQIEAEAKRIARLKRFEVKTEDKESGIKNQEESSNINENGFNTGSLAYSKKNKTKKSSENTIVENNNDNKDASLNLNSTNESLVFAQNKNSDENNSSLLNSTTQSIAIGTNSTNENDDIITPISELIRRTETEQLTASVVPVKVQQSPLASRDVLRSLIEPGKLETLDVKDQAIGINDMNPNKEKMLKNLKQFSGYDINKGFHFGAFININNVWLNKKEFSADENTTSIKPKVQFGKSYGVNIGYDYTDRWGIQVEWQISEQGQKYKIGQTDGFHTKDINLLYTKFPLMVKYKQTFINNYNSKPIALSFVFGPQIGFLIKKEVTFDGEKVKNIPEYNKVEFGVLGGFDFDLFMTRNVALTIGARSGFASSMRRGQPMSFQLGVTTQFNFRFPKKIK